MICHIAALDRVPFAAWLVVGTVAACAGAPSPARVVEKTGDALHDLRVAAEHVEAGLPLARLACAAVHGHERDVCLSVVARAVDFVPKARAVLTRADACAGKADEDECVSLAVDAANALLDEFQRGGAPAPAPSASAAPAPSGSAAR